MNAVAVEPKDGANIYKGQPIYCPKYCFGKKEQPKDSFCYHTLPSWPIVQRSHERPTIGFFLVFKPFNKNYEPTYDGMDHIRKKLSKTVYSDLIITREIKATKVHYNVMVWSADNFLSLLGTHTNKYKIYCVPFKEGKDKYQIHDYIVKESKSRPFKLYEDIYIYSNYKTLTTPSHPKRSKC